jgi:hypothetical protein
MFTIVYLLDGDHRSLLYKFTVRPLQYGYHWDTACKVRFLEFLFSRKYMSINIIYVGTLDVVKRRRVRIREVSVRRGSAVMY